MLNEKNSDVVRRKEGRGLRWRLFVRSFLLQSVWNPRGMQSIGFFFTLSPLVRSIDESEKRAFRQRHLEFFNTNPVLAPYIIGAVARAELEGRGEAEAAEIKQTLSGVLGMAGDALTWGALRPAAGLIAVAVGLYGLETGAWGVLTAPLAMLLIYNIPHFCLRARGVIRGFASGPQAVGELLGTGFRRTVLGTRWTAAFAAGFVLALSVVGGRRLGLPAVAATGAFLLLGVTAARLRIPTTIVGAAGVVGGIILMLGGSCGG